MAQMVNAMEALNALMTMDAPVEVADDSVLAPPVEPVVAPKVKRVIQLKKKPVEPVAVPEPVEEPVEAPVEAPKKFKTKPKAEPKNTVVVPNTTALVAEADAYIASHGGLLDFVEKHKKLLALEVKVNAEKEAKKTRAKNRALKKKNGEAPKTKKTALGEEDMRRIAREEALKVNGASVADEEEEEVEDSDDE